MYTCFIAVGVRSTFIADETVAVFLHFLCHGRMHIKSAEDRDIREYLTEFL